MNWRTLAKALILHDGWIQSREAAILKQEILADRVVDKEELAFLLELQREARGAVAEFEEFVLDVLKKVILADGIIGADEVRWLRKVILSDQVVSPAEVRLLKTLKEQARSISPEFEALYRELILERR